MAALQNFRSAPFAGNTDISAVILDGAAANTEGAWIDAAFANAQSIELTGSMSTMSAQIYGSNAATPPPSQYVVTIAGSVATGNVLNLVVTNKNLLAGSRTVSITVGSTQTVTAAAALFAAAINADALLGALGFSASNVAGVLTISFPSGTSGSLSNATSLSSSVGSGSGTIAIAPGTNGTAIGSAITALGLTAITTMVRWINVRLTTLTGTGANITANYHGVA